MQNIEQISKIDAQKYVAEAPKKFFEIMEQFFKSRFFDYFIFYAKIFSIILSAILIVSIILLFFKSEPIKELKKSLIGTGAKSIPKNRTQIAWAKIQKRLATKNEAEYKLAVIEADKILDNLLGLIGYKGGTLGEKLKSMSVIQLSCLDEIWQAHKIRNKIVHNPDEKISLTEAEDAIEKFKKGLEELSAL